MFDTLPSDALVPLPQSYGFARALKLLGMEVTQLNIGQDDCAGQAVVQLRPMRGIGKLGLVSRGPIWRGPPDAGALADNLRALRHPVVLNAENVLPAELRRAGFFPLMTAATIACLDLSGNIRKRMHQKWRNRLCRAEESPLKVSRGNFSAEDDKWLVEAEAVQRRKRRYAGLPIAFSEAFAKANPHMAQLFVAKLSREPVAGMLFLRHGRMASYHMGYTTNTGRALNAHNLLLFEAAKWLSRHGTDLIDLGTLDTVNAPGLARFKLGSGAYAKTLGGTWLFSRPTAPIARYL